MSPQVALLSQTMHRVTSIGKVHKAFAMKCLKAQVVGQRVGSKAFETAHQWTFLGGSSVVLQRDLQRSRSSSKGFAVSASWLTSSQLASKAFTWGTVSVLPFYTLMVLAPSAALTRRATESNLPFVVLGVVYAYLLFLSWTPDTMGLLFASKYWLPELAGISKMFLNEMTMASAWIHLLAVDLYAARQVFQDGTKNNIETRHSVSLCLLFCPVGILMHVLTKFLTKTINRSV